MVVTHAKEANCQCEQRRAEQSGARQCADLQSREAKCLEIDWQQHGDEAVTEITEATRPQKDSERAAHYRAGRPCCNEFFKPHLLTSRTLQGKIRPVELVAQS